MNLDPISSQFHGEAFESIIKSAYPGSSNFKRGPTDLFDIESKFDKILGFPTSIKTSKNKTIGLSDARRIFTINEPFRLLLLRYIQKGNYKNPYELHEFIISLDKLNELRGNLPLTQVDFFHNQLKSFVLGEHVAARKFSKDYKKYLLDNYSSAISLNPKIDSKNQRRLQCSISLNDLSNIIEPENHKIYLANSNLISFGRISIGPILSSSRTFNK